MDFQRGYLRIEKSRSMEKDRNKKSNDENNYIMIEGASWKVNLESTTERYYIVVRKKVKDECRCNQVMLSPVMRSQDKNRQMKNL